MCSGTLGHIARYHSKTSNNNKSFIVVLFHMSSSYLACISCHALLLSITSFSLFMIPMPLGYLLLLYYVLTPWICIFRFWGLERGGAFHRGLGLSRRAGRPALDLSEPTLPFGSLISVLTWAFLYFWLYLVSFWTWVVIMDTCEVILYIITCITLYFHFVCWHMIISRCVLYSDTCCTYA